MIGPTGCQAADRQQPAGSRPCTSSALSSSPLLPVCCGCAGGKTEIARRLARITDSPFIKVEATKFTEVGFFGKDVDSIIKDLARQTVPELKAKRKARYQESAAQLRWRRRCWTLSWPSRPQQRLLSLSQQQQPPPLSLRQPRLSPAPLPRLRPLLPPPSRPLLLLLRALSLAMSGALSSEPGVWRQWRWRLRCRLPPRRRSLPECPRPPRLSLRCRRRQ